MLEARLSRVLLERPASAANSQRRIADAARREAEPEPGDQATKKVVWQRSLTWSAACRGGKIRKEMRLSSLIFVSGNKTLQESLRLLVSLVLPVARLVLEAKEGL